MRGGEFIPWEGKVTECGFEGYFGSLEYSSFGVSFPPLLKIELWCNWQHRRFWFCCFRFESG